MTETSHNDTTLPPNCWRTIGVWGDESCERLGELILCQNCPVYIRSGRDRLDQPISGEYREQLASLVARPKEALDSDTTSVVIFRIGQKWLALPTSVFKRVSEPHPVHRLPHRHNDILQGLTPIQGELYLVFSLKGILALNEEEAHALPQRAFPRMVMIGRDGEDWVFSVDEMSRLHELKADESMKLEPLPGETGPGYLISMFELDQKVVYLIDDSLLFAGLRRSLQ